MSSTPFPRTTGRTKGYERRSVDSFLAHARSAFERRSDAVALTADDIRQAAFPLVRDGYEIAPVDAALGRIEDAFAARERDARIRAVGVDGWVEQARATAQIVLERISRPRTQRFRRAGLLRYGYRIDEVDLVTDKLVGYFEHGDRVTPEQVRAAAFRMQRNGYAEEQVDAVLDAVVEVMLAVTPTR
ncbi:MULTISPECIES: DivIVA domain-containing protein [Microbacterium]|uniref:DivIVA domain-containing protein n=1 Tax=Microbacterium TaxID=33882 RepID=UPI001E50B623|nr:DivIVA domain-containing protein [Microbacterium nymphoidis]MCD2497162.1 DivIVA domain-containing protein [Microbacterium nymphoidis]